VPNHDASHYRWPFDGKIAEFTSKDSKEKLASDFEPVFEGRGIDLPNFKSLQDLAINDIIEGIRVSVEYIPIPYSGSRPANEPSMLGARLGSGTPNRDRAQILMLGKFLKLLVARKFT